MHLLFWLSLIPFVTAWMGENHFATWPVALYGVALLMCGVAYSILTVAIIKNEGRESALARAVGRDVKGKASVFIYLLAVPLAVVHPWIACALYVCVAVMWFIPDRRIEKTVDHVD